MDDLFDMIRLAREKGASDIHISAGLPAMCRVDGALQPLGSLVSGYGPEELIAALIAALGEKQRAAFTDGHDLDFALQTPEGQRQRVNIFRHGGRTAASIRLLRSRIPDVSSLGLPEALDKLAEQPRGLILVTGPTGSGKSTTLAAMIERINSTRAEHIITIEDPIEYVYGPGLSLIHQREIGLDAPSFAAALRSALREDPDLILVGEMRDYETIAAALTAAETGHLVLSTLHTCSAALTVDRIIDACPSPAQNQIRAQLAGVLKGVVTQCLIPARGGGRVPATEVLIGTDAVSNMIRDNKPHQLPSLMQSGSKDGMHTLSCDLARLVRAERISRESAFKYTNDKKELEEYL